MDLLYVDGDEYKVDEGKRMIERGFLLEEEVIQQTSQ